MEEIEHEQLEIDSLENSLLRAEYKYKADVELLQQALMTCKRLDNLHILGLHVRFRTLYRATQRLPMQCSFYKWKAMCNIDRTNRVKKVAKMLKFLYKQNLTKAFILFRERGNRLMMERIINRI